MFSYLGHNARWLALSYLLWGIGEGLWLYVQPLYIAGLGADPAQIGVVMGVMALVRVFVNLPAGWLADRFEARRVMLPGWFLGVAGVALIALAPDWRWLIPAFAVYGLSGYGVPVSAAYANRVVEMERETHPTQSFNRVLTTLYAAYSAGLIVSPAVGGWLGAALGLRPVFFISAAWFALSVLAVLRTRPAPAVARQPGPGYSGLLRLRWLVLAAFPVALTFVAMALVAPTTGLTAKFMEDVRGFDVATIGALGSINALGMTLLNLALGRDANALRAFLAAVALIGVGAGLFLLSGDLGLVGVGYFVAGSVMAARPLVESAIVQRIRVDQRGVVLAAVESIFSLGTAAGTWTAGWLYAGLGPQAPFEAALIVLPVTGALCWLALRVPRGVRAAAPATPGAD